MAKHAKSSGPALGDDDKPTGDAAPQGADDTSLADETEPDPQPDVPAHIARGPSADGLVLAKGPEGCENCSWNGQVFDADNGGVFELPVAAFADLQAHGFTAYVDEQPAE